MFCVGQWFFTLLRKCIDTVGQVALRRQLSVFLVRFPGCVRHFSPPFSSFFRVAIASSSLFDADIAPRCCVESSGRWYWRHPGIVPREIKYARPVPTHPI